MLLLKNQLSETYCYINFIEAKNTIYVQWQCKANLSEVKKAVKHILELQEKVRASAFLTDYTKCRGFEQSTIEFLNQEFFPMIGSRGITKHAFIFSENAYDKLMKQAFCSYYANLFEVAVFNCLQKGNNWLQKATVKSAS